jgi:2-dehydro-3-deoxyphosphogluconate aldolase/(4S)-4-hydroxy-2-oxoglutarate aldolase
MDKMMNRFKRVGIVPVVVIEDVERAEPTADALLAGDVDVVEITLRTASGLDCIRKLAARRPEITTGAGTVLTLEQCETCVDAGAKFIVSPGLDLEMARWCSARGVPFLPGCTTPTEIMLGMKEGIGAFKFFPASMFGGLPALKALHAPFRSVSFIPTGGVNEKNLADFLSVPFIPAVGGSWLCSESDIAAGDFKKITALCKEARRIADGR